MKLIPRFSPEFLASVVADSPEDMFVRSVGNITFAYRNTDVFHRFHDAWFDDFVEKQNKPLYVINHRLSYGPQPSEDVISAVWKERLRSYGEYGEIVVDAIGNLRTACELLLGKQIDFCMPYKREINQTQGYINGQLIDYAPTVTEDPTLLIQIGNERVNGQGLHFPILGLCGITIH